MALTSRRRLATGLAAAALASASLLATSPAIAAPGSDSTGVFAAGSGIVGVQQTVAYTLNSTDSPGAPVQIMATGSASASPVVAATVYLNSGVPGTFTWVPPHVGTWTFCPSQSFSSCSGSTFINQVGVNVSVSAPNTVKVGAPTTVTATVTSQSGSNLAPLGSVQFTQVGVGNLGAPVWLSGGSPSTASISWTPNALGTAALTATYTPYVVNGVSDTTCSSNCTSAQDVVQVTASGAYFYLGNPGSLYVGTPNTLSAFVGVSPPTGSVTFTVNGAVIAQNVPVNAAGVATASYTPPAAGNYNLAATWISNSGQTGSAQETLPAVGAPFGPAVDGISLVGAGMGVWNPAAPLTLANGTTVALTATAASGATVSISDSGPCNMSGNTLIVDQGSGQCRIIANSPGGNGYQANQVVYTVNLVPGQQTATVSAPASGRVNKGKTLQMESAAQGDTNAGQNIIWTITKGKNSVCKLAFPSSGAVNLKIVGKGYCTVKGSAPAVSGQWAKYVTSRTYQGV